MSKSSVSEMFASATQLQTQQPVKYSPWGIVERQSNLAPGLIFVSTAIHGGFWISPERSAKIRQHLPDFQTFNARECGLAWHEEDCDAAAVVATNPEAFSPDQVITARRQILANQRYYGRWVDAQPSPPPADFVDADPDGLA